MRLTATLFSVFLLFGMVFAIGPGQPGLDNQQQPSEVNGSMEQIGEVQQVNGAETQIQEQQQAGDGGKGAQNQFEIKTQNQAAISVRNEAGEVIAIVDAQNVEEKNGKIYAFGANQSLDIYPSDILDSELPPSVSVGLIYDGQNYRYQISSSEQYSSGTPLLALRGPYKIMFAAGVQEIYVNDTVIEIQKNIHAPVQIQLRDKDQIRTMLIMHEGGNLSMLDGDVTARVRTNMEIQNEVMYAGGKEIGILPATLRDRVQNRTRAQLSDLELNLEGNRSMYSFQLQKEYRLFGLIPLQAQVKTKLDATNGTVMEVNQPWWAFISTEAIDLPQNAPLD